MRDDAQGDQGGTATANASPNPRARELDQAGGQRLLRLPAVPTNGAALAAFYLQPLKIVMFLVGSILIARWHPPRKIKREQLRQIFD